MALAGILSVARAGMDEALLHTIFESHSWPVRTTPSEVLSAGIHNRDERIHVDDLAYGLDFTLHACRRVGALTS